jgi:hypothetical protein
MVLVGSRCQRGRSKIHQNIVIFLVFQVDMYQKLRVLRYGRAVRQGPGGVGIGVALELLAECGMILRSSRGRGSAAESRSTWLSPRDHYTFLINKARVNLFGRFCV